ncbi:MAG: transcriptional regulator [Candidatus Micrarchaeota archaeon]
MEDRITKLVTESKALNSKIFSLPRLLVLLSLEKLDQDGATYRELKAGLELDDGVLYSNLNALKNMGYLTENEIRLEKKKMASFAITSEGKEALLAARGWLGKWLRGGKNE